MMNFINFKRKYINLILFLFILFIVSVGTVSAETNNITDNNDLSNDELNTLYPEIRSDNSNNNFISNASNFTDLEKDIQKSNQIKLSQDIILENNEYSLYNKGIKINKNLTIDGNQHTIYTFNATSIFNTMNNATLILKNIKLLNINNTTNNNDTNDILLKHNMLFFKELNINNDILLLKMNSLVKYYHGAEPYTCTLTKNTKPMANVKIIFNINDASYERITDSDGVASLNINLNSGKYTITANYNNLISDTAEVLVKPTIESSDLTKYFKDTTLPFTAKILDSTGKIIKNQITKFNVNGVSYNSVSDDNGISTLNINLIAGNYIITSTNPVTGEKISNTIIVRPTLEASDLIKIYGEDDAFTIKALDNKGNILTNCNILLNINGMFYTRTTNASGIAQLNIRLPARDDVYIITSTNPVTGEKKSNQIIVLSDLSHLDLRKYHLTSDPKNQSGTQTCWDFAALACLESFLLKNKGFNNSYDLSENNLKNIMSKNSYYGVNRDSVDGGNFPLALAYLLNYYGPINENTDPFDVNNNVSNFFNPLYHVQGALKIPKRNNPNDNNNIKRAIMKYGAIYTSMVLDKKLIYDEVNYYLNLTDLNNVTTHAVSIVGWDDSYSAENFIGLSLESNGAFIIKDSITKKYLYVSYYDLYLARIDDCWAFTSVENNDNYKGQYYYDLYGIYCIDGLLTDNYVGCANSFVANDTSMLSAFGFYSLDNTDYTVNIYVNDDSFKKSSYSSNGHVNAGYNTIKLNNPVKINKNDKFTIAVILKNSPVVLCISNDKTNNSYSLINRLGQSYIYNSNNDNWIDLYTTNLKDKMVSCVRGYVSSIVSLKASHFNVLSDLKNNIFEIHKSSKDNSIKCKIVDELDNGIPYANINIKIKNNTNEIYNKNYTVGYDGSVDILFDNIPLLVTGTITFSYSGNNIYESSTASYKIKIKK